MFGLPIAKRDSQGCLRCAKRTALGLNIERVFGVTVSILPTHSLFNVNTALILGAIEQLPHMLDDTEDRLDDDTHHLGIPPEMHNTADGVEEQDKGAGTDQVETAREKAKVKVEEAVTDLQTCTPVLMQMHQEHQSTTTTLGTAKTIYRMHQDGSAKSWNDSSSRTHQMDAMSNRSHQTAKWTCRECQRV